MVSCGGWVVNSKQTNNEVFYFIKYFQSAFLSFGEGWGDASKQTNNEDSYLIKLFN